MVNVSLPSDNPVLDARALSFPADGSVLRQVTLAVGEGETVAVLGPAGSGKTVLLRCLTGHLTPGSGSVWANGKAFHLFSADQRRAFQRRNFGLVPQKAGFVPELTLLQNTSLPLLFTGVARDEATARARVWLDRFELGEHGNRRISSLPEEAVRRAALARGMVTDPLILFADEPLAGLEDAEVATIARMLLSIARSHGTSVLCFTREATMADRFQRRIDLAQGRTLNRPVPAAPAKAARAPKPAALQPTVVPRAVTVSVPGGGLASTAAHGVGPVVLPAGAGGDGVGQAGPVAPVAMTGNSGGGLGGADEGVSAPSAAVGKVTMSAGVQTAAPGELSGAPTSATTAASVPHTTLSSATMPAGSPTTATGMPPASQPASFRPPIPPSDPRLRGGLPLGKPSHFPSGSAQVRP